MTNTFFKIYNLSKYILLLAVCIGVYALPSFASAESISLFESDIVLLEDSSFVVTETITYDFEAEQRHGIFRFVPTQHPQEASSFFKERYVDLEVLEVSQDGTEVPYEVSKSSGELEIKIGDPNTYITGEHTYMITYKVEGGLSYFDDGTSEIYWNVTGNSWEVPIARVVAEVATHRVQTLQEKACYVGEEGGTDACEISDQDDVVVFEANNLSAGSGLTIAQHIQANSVAHIVLERFNVGMLVLLVLPLLVIGSGVFVYRYQTKFKTGNPIIAQYEPYTNLKPMYSGMLLDGALDPHDITAGIVYLAQQGFIKIKKTEKKVLYMFEVDDYEIELLRPQAEIETNFLYSLSTLLFDASSSVGTKITLGELKKDTSQQTENYALIQQLRKDLKDDMRKQDFYQVRSMSLASWLGIGAVFLVYIAVSIAVAVFVSEILFVGLLCALIIGLCVLAFIYERRTRKGYEVQDHLKGFKLFLSVTDAERFAFHNAPEKSPEQFMKFLPYAIAFGVEKKWAEVFKDITIPTPSWYDSGSVHTFSAVQLSTSLGAFSTSFAASSGSYSSSGSSGGGFSGGGGGGGGGGSW